MDNLQPVLTGLLSAVIGGSLIGLAWWFKIRRMIEGRDAEKFANDWHQQVIARQDREAERLRAEIHVLREASTMTSKRVLELELDNKVKQNVIREMVEDIRLVKRDKMTVDQLQTGSYTGTDGRTLANGGAVCGVAVLCRAAVLPLAYKPDL